MATKARKTRDALAIIDRRFFTTREARAELERARASSALARQILTLRTAAGLTQRQLAERVGTTASVISRLEHDDYRGHSLSILHRIAAALNKRLAIKFVAARNRRRARSA